jgi:hypothetical protein
MVLKKKLDPKVILFNGAAAVIMGSAAVVHLKSVLFPPGIPVCSERYNRTITFTLERQGKLLSASDIQSIMAGRDYGVLDNFAVERIEGAPSKSVIGVDIKSGSAHPQNEAGTPGGIAFPWKPRAIPAGATSACLAYSVFLPADFEFEAGGTLPGIFGVRTGDLSEKADRFDTRVEWVDGGQAIHFMMIAAETSAGFYRSFAEQRFVLPRGRWVRLEQEVVLNEPGQSNAAVRFWMDGVLVSENKEAELRTRDDVLISGVAADVHFGIQKTEGDYPYARAKKNERVMLSPFELKFE